MASNSKKKGRRCERTAWVQPRPVVSGEAPATAYPAADQLDARDWAAVHRALRTLTKSATMAGLMAISGAMFGGCMPAVRPDAVPPPYETYETETDTQGGAVELDPGTKPSPVAQDGSQIPQ